MSEDGDRSALAERIVELTARRGLRLAITGDEVEIHVDDRRHRRRARWLPKAAAVDLRHRPPGPDEFVLADRLMASAAEALREAGTSFADATGRLHVRAPGVLVDVQERRRPAVRSASDGAHAVAGHGGSPTWNLMSAARAQVVFCLLQWPELIEGSVRALAESAGVSVGSAQSALDALDQEHHLTLGGRRLTRRDELLDQWAAAFPGGLGRKIQLGIFVGEPTPHAWVARDLLVHVSGAYAVEGITDDTLTLYVDRVDAKAVMDSRWRAPRAAENETANIIVRKRFWRAPPWSVGDVSGAATAPELLVYADLLASGEPRQRERARQLRDRLA